MKYSLFIALILLGLSSHAAPPPVEENKTPAETATKTDTPAGTDKKEASQKAESPVVKASEEKKETENADEKEEEKSPIPINFDEYKIPDGKSVPKAEIIDENQIRIGNVTINKKDRSISIPAYVNMQEGLIEYLVSMPHGKLHEALLITTADPLHISVAAKLLKMKSFNKMFPQRDDNMEWKPYTEPKRADFLDALVDITASWKKDGKTITMPVSDFIKFKSTTQYLSSHEWAFIDSSIYKKTYQASAIGDVIAIFGDTNAIISYTGFGNDGENIWMADPKRVPTPGTEVTITIKSLPKKEADKPVARRPKDLSLPEPTTIIE